MFNPFGKNFSEIVGEDLKLLRTVNEGWFVEYKSAIIDSSAIGKAMTAFANHDGGWLFLGIKEKDNHADSFIGIASAELELAERRLREAASRHCIPSPHYEKKFIMGPVSEIELPENRCIVIVLIPRSHNTPHIHSSGKIYRRIDSSSEPKAETDRSVLDMLWNRREVAQKRMERFCSWRPDISKGEAALTYLHIALMADPFGDRALLSKMDIDGFWEIMSSNEAGGIVFDSVYPCQGGAIARHVSSNDPSRQIFTYRYYWNGSARITVPLNTFPLSRAPSPDYGSNAKALAQAISRRGYGSSVVIDLSRMLLLLNAIVIRYRYLLSRDSFEVPCIYFRICAQQVWRRIPFLDSSDFVKHIADNGVPMMESDDLVIPETGLLTLAGTAHSSLDESSPEVVGMFMELMDAFGIPRTLFTSASNIIPELVQRGLSRSA